MIYERFDPSLPPVRVNRAALLQVVINLLKNACEAVAGQAEPRILLTTAYRQGVAIDAGPDKPRRALPIELAVIDNGPGAPSDIADLLFDPFVSGRPEGKIGRASWRDRVCEYVGIEVVAGALK